MADRPQMPSSFEGNDDFYNERALNKIVRKLKEEPLIPLGAGLTVFAFVQAYRATRRGDARTANVMFRYRVGAQAFTVAAMVAGSLYYSKDRERTKELRALREQREAEEKRVKWIAELEARDEEEKAIRAMMEKRRARAGERGAAGPGTKADAAGNKKETGGGGGGILGSLGLWSRSADATAQPQQQQEQEGAKPEQPEPASKKERNPRSTLGDLGQIISKKSGENEKK